MLSILPQKRPSRTEIGMEIIMARMIPGMPHICQSATKIRPISPAMAPSVIPKFSPIPAIIGINRLRIRKAFLPNLVTISLSRYPGEKPDIGMQTTQIMINISGTVLFRTNSRMLLLPLFFCFLLILIPPSSWSEHKESYRWKQRYG